jgi:hypothetical protein
MSLQTPGEGASRGGRNWPDTVSNSVGPVEKESFVRRGFDLIFWVGSGL